MGLGIVPQRAEVLIFAHHLRSGLVHRNNGDCSFLSRFLEDAVAEGLHQERLAGAQFDESIACGRQVG